MTIVVRQAAPDDAADLSRLRVRAWQAGYRGVMPDGFLDALDPAGATGKWRQLLTGARDQADGLTVLVAVAGDRLVAFANVGPGDPAAATSAGRLGQLYALNADPDAWGTGAALAVHDAGLEVLRRNGFAEAVLWVAAGNARGRRFYEREGWRPDGREQEETFTLPGGERATVREVGYRITL